MSGAATPTTTAHRSNGAALFIHLLDRYVHDVPNKGRIDQAIAAALGGTIHARTALPPILARWKSTPVAQRQAMFGPTFGDLSPDAAIADDVLEQELRQFLSRRLASVAPGIRGTASPKPAAPDADLPPGPAQLNLDIGAAAALLQALRPPHDGGVMPLSGQLQPAYRIDFAGIYCQKETSWDQSSNSDEPYVLFTTSQRFREPWAARSDVYEHVHDGIDSGDDWGPLPPLLTLFGEESAEPAAETAITAVVMEHDAGDPDAYKEEVRLVVKAGQAVAAYYGIPIPDAVANLATEVINALLDTGDDTIGVSTAVLDPGAFGYYAQQPLTHFKHQLDYHFYTYHDNGDAKYYVMYRVVEEAPVAFGSGTGEFDLATTGVAISSWAAGRLDVYGRGTDNTVWHRAWEEQPFQWSEWDSLIGGSITSAPAAVSWGANRIDVVGRGQDNALWHRPYSGQWGEWNSLGGVLTSAPAICSWAAGRLDIFARGQDNAVWHRAWDEAAFRWSGWDSISGVITSAPAAVSWGAGRIDVVALGQDSALWHTAYEGGSGWSTWTSLGGVLTSSPAICSWAPGRLDIFARGQDNAVWHLAYDNGWSGWDTIGGVITSAPAAVSWGPGRINVVARGQNNALWHIPFDGQWGTWSSLEGVLN